MTRKLTKPQLEALLLLRHGFTAKEAAASLRITDHAVKVRLRLAREKLEARNTLEAVANAMREGLIE